ncbi:hypothetical protein [Bosea sp. NBC_00550]|uniref:hypothetical protein n=1 Tax=Bosea sp. NBC_00550 TaxID=2969621 RepID=UPI002232088A|nr:hypothetical protein [Bosea sp. NBC_00550]UZF95477.1 hypothetical protein NWE53_28770 [Bosea sp. NBC_00550]
MSSALLPDDGAEGFENFDALGGGRRSVFRPIGAAPEMAIRTGEGDYRGHRWPPRLGHEWPPKLPTDCWPIAPGAIPACLTDFTPDNASLLVLAEFVELPKVAGQAAWTVLLQPGDMQTDIDLISDVDGDNCSTLQRELKHLRRLAQFRSGVMSEALAQRNGIIGYFRALLQFSLQTHPHTYYLAATALRLGQFLACTTRTYSIARGPAASIQACLRRSILRGIRPIRAGMRPSPS